MDSYISHWRDSQAFKRGAAIGALVLTFVGAAWAIAALANWPDTRSWEFAIVAIPVLALTALGVARLIAVAALPKRQLPDTDAAERARHGRKVGLLFAAVFTAEILAIAVAAIFLSHAGRPLLIPVAIVAIVGVHFLPLAKAFHIPTYGIAGILLLAASLASLLIVNEPARVFALGLVVALVLWVSAGTVLALHTGRRTLS